MYAYDIQQGPDQFSQSRLPVFRPGALYSLLRAAGITQRSFAFNAGLRAVSEACRTGVVPRRTVYTAMDMLGERQVRSIMTPEGALAYPRWPRPDDEDPIPQPATLNRVTGCVLSLDATARLLVRNRQSVWDVARATGKGPRTGIILSGMASTRPSSVDSFADALMSDPASILHPSRAHMYVMWRTGSRTGGKPHPGAMPPIPPEYAVPGP